MDEFPEKWTERGSSRRSRNRTEYRNMGKAVWKGTIMQEEKRTQPALIHIYTGDGKGKTTAAVGLAIRFAGNGGRVLFAQLLKDGSSGEIRVLEKTDGIDVFICRECFGFSFAMTEAVREKAKAVYRGYLSEVLEKAAEGGYGLLVLDEILSAYNQDFIDRQGLVDFLRNRPAGLEVVLTGRNPAPELAGLADYISETKKVRHPYDQGIMAREGIEY